MTRGAQTLKDIHSLRDLGWTWTRIAAHYRTSEREVRRWVKTGEAPADLAPPVQLRFGTALIVNDTQYPAFDPALWEVTCQVARDAEVDRLIWDGDILDFEQFSSFRHNPYKITTAAEDVRGFHRDLRDPIIEACGKTLQTEEWNDGNHEFRYQRYCEHNAGAVGVYPSPQEFYGLPEQVVWQPYGRALGTMLTPRLLVAHGWQARKHSAYTAKANLEDVGNLSVITGHTHRVGLFMVRTRTGVQASYEVGHMCDETKVPKAVEGINNWQQVAGTLVRYERGGDAFDVELLPVFGRGQDRVIADGREYRIAR